MATSNFDTCAHSVFDWRNCQRCGRPHCADCISKAAPDGSTHCALPRAGVVIPLQLCVECRHGLQALDATIPAKLEDAPVRCKAHAGQAGAGKATPVSSCSACTQSAELHRRLMTEAVLNVLLETKWYGEGGKRTNAAKAGVAALTAVPMLAVNTVGGVLGGLFSGALGGAASGFIMAGAYGLDAGNAMGGKGKGKDAKPATPKPAAAAPAPAAAGGDGSPASTASSAAAGGAPAPAPAAPTTEAGEKIAAMMAKAKTVLRMSAEEQEADAEAECARIAACKTAYEVLGIPPSATANEVSKAHKAKSMAYHPDKNNAVKAKDVSQAANNAYTLLSDPDKRAKYDASGYSDTSGVDLGEGVNIEISTTRRGMAAGAVSGVLGGIAGLGLGAAAGVVGGALSGVAGTIARAREYSLDSIPASTFIAERVAARRTVLKKEEAKYAPALAAATATPAAPTGSGGSGGGEGLAVQVDPIEGKVAVTVPLDAYVSVGLLPSDSTGPGSASTSTALTTTTGPASSSPDLSITPFTLPSIQADLELVVGPRFLERYSRTAGSSDGDRLFARRYAKSVGEVASFQRKQLGVPEPRNETGAEDGTPAGHNGPDATGMHGGDTYEDREKANSTTISSAGGLLSHMSEHIGKEVSGMRSAQESQVWALLAARYEARSRGLGDDESEEFLIGRLKAIVGDDEDEDEGDKDKEKEKGKDGAAGGADASKASKDKGKGGKKGKAASIKPIADPDAALGGSMSAPVPTTGPFVVVEVAVVQNSAAAAAGKGGSTAAKAGATKGAASADPGCGPWRPMFALPLADEVAKARAHAQAQARAAAGGESAAPAALPSSIKLDCGSLPLALLADVPGGQGGAGAGAGAEGVRLRVRTYASPCHPQQALLLSAAGVPAAALPPTLMLAPRVTEIVLPREALAAAAGREAGK